jgi:hypothetical protein
VHAMLAIVVACDLLRVYTERNSDFGFPGIRNAGGC